MVLEDDSKECVTIHTHRGLYRYNRLPYGVFSAPDDEHLQNLEEVMKRLSEAGLRLKRSKCRFMQPVLGCLGYRISAQGIYPAEAKVQAVTEAP
ncbi:Hypothetical predicted protein, partial [Paramuricea clavata]